MVKLKPVKHTHCSLLCEKRLMCVATPQTVHTCAADRAYLLCGKLRGDSPITALANSKVSRQKIQFPVTCTVLFLMLATVPPIKMFTENRCIAYLRM